MLPHGENHLRSSSFFCIFALVLTLMLFTAESRYLRPSDHGLMYQNNRTGLKSTEMKSFFGGASTELPEARNSSKPWWTNTGSPATFVMSKDDGRKNRMREVLLISSLACGVVAVALVVAGAFIYFFQRRRSSLQSSSSCKQIVEVEAALSFSMAQMTVLKVSITCQRCKKKILKAVSGLEGIDKIEVDAAKGTLTVIGNADPCEVVVRVRKGSGRCVEVVSIGPPPKPNSPKEKSISEVGTNKGKSKTNENPIDCILSRSCHSCERVYIIWDYPDVSCSIL